MPRTWKALPLSEGYQLLLKAPTHRAYTEQLEAGPEFKPTKALAEEIMAASVVIDALDDEGVRLPQGATYKLYRYAHGLAVTMPSGWSVYMPLEGQKRNPKEQAANEETPVEADEEVREA